MTDKPTREEIEEGLKFTSRSRRRHENEAIDWAARAYLTSLAAGWLAMPREPTDAMFEGWRSVNCKTEGEWTSFSGDYGNWLACYRAMLAALDKAP